MHKEFYALPAETLSSAFLRTATPAFVLFSPTKTGQPGIAKTLIFQGVSAICQIPVLFPLLKAERLNPLGRNGLSPFVLFVLFYFQLLLRKNIYAII